MPESSGGEPTIPVRVLTEEGSKVVDAPLSSDLGRAALVGMALRALEEARQQVVEDALALHAEYGGDDDKRGPVHVATPAYQDGWERIYGRRPDRPQDN